MRLARQDWRCFTESGSLIRLNKDNYLIGWGTRTWLENIYESPSPFFYFPDFFLSSPCPWFQQEYTAIVSQHELLAAMHTYPATPLPLSWKNPYLAHFENTCKELHTHFYNKKLKKAVPYIFEESLSTMTPDRLGSSLKHLINYVKDQQLHVYGYWEETEGILGASPEILFNYHNASEGLIETVACAGTKRYRDSDSIFIQDSKELYEHQLVIEGIQESLSSLGVVTIGELQILQLPKISHLMTPIQLKMKGPSNFLALVKALHPTPALGAFPKEEGKKWLHLYNDKIDRWRYGAPVGCLFDNKKQARCIVGIRNVQWNSQGAKIGAGCGIVPASQWHHEWQEINLKLLSIKEMIAL
jgi:menaquinone-specific isochorismate synthase